MVGMQSYISLVLYTKYNNRAAVSGGAGGALAPLEFRSSNNPIPTREGQIVPITLLLAPPDLKT